MSRAKKTHDVFLSYPLDLQAQAKQVIAKFEKAGLVVFAIRELESSQGVIDESWQALAESWAVIVILRPGKISPSVGVEIGAAAAWKKPVYVLVEGEPGQSLGLDFSGYQAFPLSDADIVVDLVLSGLRPLNDKERTALVEAYKSLGVPTDKLLMDPGSVQDLNRTLWEQSRVKLSGERVMQELLRLRKQGKLPRVTTRR